MNPLTMPQRFRVNTKTIAALQVGDSLQRNSLLVLFALVLHLDLSPRCNNNFVRTNPGMKCVDCGITHRDILAEAARWMDKFRNGGGF